MHGVDKAAALQYWSMTERQINRETKLTKGFTNNIYMTLESEPKVTRVSRNAHIPCIKLCKPLWDTSFGGKEKGYDN